LILNSSGGTFGSAAQLSETGYVGTYINVPNSGDGGSLVNLTMNANRASSGSGAFPHMNIAVADSKFGFSLSSTSAADFSTGDQWLPEGTYFVRVERDSPSNPSSSTRTARVNTLDVSGASFANFQSNSNALNAANTYIDNFRKGPAELTLLGVPSGTNVQVKLKRHDFNFGTVASGFTSFDHLGDNPTPGSAAYNYQQFVNGRFNSLVPSNAGKWTYNEPHQDQVEMDHIDDYLQYVEDHNMRSRMHNLLWETGQQPYWVCCFGGFDGLLDIAAGGGPGAATAKEQLRQEIIERIDYYVRDRANQYVEIDVVNESLHQERYWQVFGASGFAEFFNEVADAIDDAGSNATAMLNEFNVIQWSEDPLNPGTSDPYANWYREHAEEIMTAGGQMSGIGVQYYADRRQPSDGLGSAAHNPGRILQAFQNLAVSGLPIALTEFGVIDNGGSGTFDWDWTTQIMEETMRMTFGMPDATSFMIWDIISNNSSDFGLVNSNYLNPTQAADAFDDLMSEWDTEVTLEVGPDGTIDFSGFFGDYEITIDGETFDLSLLKGTTEYELAIGTPLLGDYNNDGVVDAADYTVWRDAMEDGASELFNEGDSFGTVDEADYQFWRDHFGDVLIGGGSSAAAAGGSPLVPEPASAGLLLLGVLAGAMLRRRFTPAIAPRRP
jgi:GH35 family endo-1,4-beta-xylanase